jgi:hypothetical protein
MPGHLLGQDTQALCGHGGQAQPTVVFPRVKLSGAPVVLQPAPFQVLVCPHQVPCKTGHFQTGAVRVRAQGQPVLLRDSQATCVPSGSPLRVLQTQVRVKGI